MWGMLVDVDPRTFLQTCIGMCGRLLGGIGILKILEISA